MNLDELRAVQNKERQKDSLQHLRESFYADVAEYVERLREERDAAADAAEDPFADPEVRRLTDEIETATDVAEAVYERRLGKLVKRASLAAADMPTDDEGLTAEERALFDDLVDRITENKNRVLDVVEGEADPLAGADAGDDATAPDAAAGADPGEPTGDSPGEPTGADRDRGTVDAADAMGGGDPADAMGGGDPADARPADGPPTGTANPGGGPEGGRPSGETPEAGRTDPTDVGAADAAPTSGAAGDASMGDRTTVRITDDVGAIFGVEGREYDLGEDDVVSLPAENADPLLERGAAERVD